MTKKEKYYIISGDCYLKISSGKFFFVSNKDKAGLFDIKKADKIINENKSYKFKKELKKPKLTQLELF